MDLLLPDDKSIITEEKRSQWPDEIFGIPELRKYPMPDEKHTRSAIKLFNHVDPKHEEELAKNIIKNMKKYNIDPSVVGPNNRLNKYLKDIPVDEEAAMLTKNGYYRILNDYKDPKACSWDEELTYPTINDCIKYDTSVDKTKDLHIYNFNVDDKTYEYLGKYVIHDGDLVLTDKIMSESTVFEYGTTMGTLAPTNAPDNVKLKPNNLMNMVFSGEEIESIFGAEYAQELTSIEEIVRASITGDMSKYIPVFEYYTEGRPYNYYRDFNGVFAINEFTGYRTKSYDSIFDITDREKQLIVWGIY